MACYLVDISLFFCKAELTQALVLYFFEEVVLEEFFDDGILERVACLVCTMEFCGRVVVEEIVGEMDFGIGGDVVVRGPGPLCDGVGRR